MNKTRLIVRIVFSAIAFCIFTGCAAMIMLLDRHHEPTFWELTPEKPTLLLDVVPDEAQESLQLFLLAFSPSRDLERDEAEMVFQASAASNGEPRFNVVIVEWGYESYSYSDQCTVNRIRLESGWRAYRCDMRRTLRADQTSRLNVVGTLDNLPDGVQVQLVGVPEEYLDGKDALMVFAAFSGLAYLIGCFFVVAEVRRGQKRKATP